jgi:predicted transglutaminase-like cysteine proteinase
LKFPAQRLVSRGAAMLTLLAYCALAAGDRGFAGSVTPGLVQNLVKRFGPPARERIADWVAFAKSRKAAGTAGSTSAWSADRLQVVNTFLNQVPWLSDQAHWSAADYWATPAETVGSHGADCEDYAIAKYFLLKELGVPIHRLRITYVRAVRLNEPHMVLAYYARTDAEPLILDNLDDRVRLASARSDLIPVYSFNDEDVVLERSNRFNSEGTLAVRNNQRGNASQIRLWRQFNERLDAEARL